MLGWEHKSQSSRQRCRALTWRVDTGKHTGKHLVMPSGLETYLIDLSAKENQRKTTFYQGRDYAIIQHPAAPLFLVFSFFIQWYNIHQCLFCLLC